MAYVSSAAEPRELVYPETATAQRPSRGLWRRLFDAMIAARRRQAEREIELYLRGIGGKFTDHTEREIERRFMSSPSRW
jgi:hypothetical protein